MGAGMAPTTWTRAYPGLQATQVGRPSTRSGKSNIIFHNNQNPINSSARSGHTAWTPPSPPDSIVLLGGLTIGPQSAETVPGFFFKIEKLTLI